MGIQKIYYAFIALFISLLNLAPTASAQDVGDTQKGLASWYGARYHGRPTSSGEKFNRHKYTAAHNGLPLGTRVKVTNVSTGESVIVKINDRGPFKGPRVIDLSEAAANKIKSREQGLAKVTVEVIDLPEAFLAKRAKARKAAEQDEIMLAAVSTPSVAPATTITTTPAVKATTVTATLSPALMSSLPTLVNPSVYVVQAGAYGEVHNAEAQVSRLRRIYQKLPIALVEEALHGRIVHRILAGRFMNRTTAEQAQKDLDKKGFEVIVVREAAKSTSPEAAKPSPQETATAAVGL